MSYFDNRLKAPKINTLPGKVTDYSEVDILVQKGNVLHLLLLLLLFVYCIVFAIINYVLGHSTEVILTLVPLPFVILSYILYKKGYSVLSKFINLFQITTVVGMLSMVSTPVTGVLAFYIPVLLGAQLTFHGKERKYAHILTVYALIALVFFLTTDIKIGDQPILKLNNPQDLVRLHTEWFFNFFGAALATTFEIIFILSVSNKIQQDLFDKSDLVNKKNTELNSALQTNIESSELISRQLDLIKKSEQELTKLSLIATKTNTGVIITDAHGRVEWVNDAFTKISGHTMEDAKGKKPKEFLQAKDLNHPSQQILHDKLSRKEFVEVIIPNLKKNGEVFINQLEVNPVFDEKGALINFVSLQRDVTAEKEQQNEILRINKRFDHITTHSGIGIWVWEIATNKVIWNDILIGLYGAVRSEVENDLYLFWRDSVHTEDREQVFANIEKLVSGELSIVNDEMRIIRKDNGELRYLKSLTFAERDEKGNLIQLLGSAIDVTEQRLLQNSLSQKNEELLKANGELDKFVYSVSHDLRSPLLSIKGLLSLVVAMPELDAKVSEYLGMAQKSVGRLDETIAEILEYSRNSRLNLNFETFDVKEMVLQIFESHKFIVEEGFDFKIDISGDSNIHSDRARMHTLFRNLIGNAVKYRRPGEDNQYVQFSLKRINGKIIMSVKDNGEGIPEYVKPKVFEMFYRGSTTGAGTGLGLYICKQIVEKLDGNLDLESEEKKGASFKVIVPDSSITK